MDDFVKELGSTINRHSKENASNTPDFILAQFLEACLAAWDVAVQQRETWYGRDGRPSRVEEPEPGWGPLAVQQNEELKAKEHVPTDGERRAGKPYWDSHQCPRIGDTLALIRGKKCPECGWKWAPAMPTTERVVKSLLLAKNKAAEQERRLGWDSSSGMNFDEALRRVRVWDKAREWCSTVTRGHALTQEDVARKVLSILDRDMP